MPVMGFVISRITRKREKNIIFLGLDGSGKTAILHSMLKIAAKPLNIPLTPTMGFNAESFTYLQKKILVWDLSGDENVRDYWSCYFTNVFAIFYFIDQYDSERYNYNLQIIEDLSQKNELKNAIFSFMITKKDLQRRIDIENISQIIEQKFKGRKHKIFHVSIFDAISIRESMNWVIHNN